MHATMESAHVVSGVESGGATLGPTAPSTQGAQSEARTNGPWCVLLVDDDATDRNLLKVLLEENTEIQVVGEASDGEEAVVLAERYRPDVILMDIHLPHVSGVEATRHINGKLPHVVIIGVSSQYTPYHYNAMIAAGAVAFVRKEDAVEALYKTIEFSLRTQSSNRHIGPSHSSAGTPS
jgi:DNA-binding NarL/FixJ family response regulator